MLLKEYLTETGNSPFGKWFGKLDAVSTRRVTVEIVKLQNGRRGNHKSLGGGLRETKLKTGGGLRVYWMQDGETIIVLLAGAIKPARARILK